MSGATGPVGPSWTVGDVRITSVVEGEHVWPFAALLPSVTPSHLADNPWLRAGFVDDEDRMLLRIQALVVESMGRTIVVDTCIGDHKPRPVPAFDRLESGFLDRFQAAGFSRHAVDAVVCTHLHVDHVGWNTMLVDGAWVPTFPNARHLFGRIEYGFWSQETGDLARSVLADSVEPIVAAGLHDLVESDHRITDEVRLEPTPGHTPGHHSVIVESAGRRAVITGDMIHHPVQFADPAVASSADEDAATSTATRRAAFARWEADGSLVIGTHFSGPGAGTLAAVGGGEGWRFVTER